jgi:hypothetical protein
VPFADAGLLQSKPIKGATLKVYKGAPHGLCTTHKDEVSADLVAFAERKEAHKARRAIRSPSSQSPLNQPTIIFGSYFNFAIATARTMLATRNESIATTNETRTFLCQ